MKKIQRLIYLLLIVGGFVSCDDLNERVLPSISGKSGDLLVVVDSVYWNNQTGKEIQAVFSKEQEGLPQREALFNIIKIPHYAFARIFHTMRNIIMVKIDPEEKIKIEVRENVWAKTQILITITAPNDKIAAETIQKNGVALLDYFNHQEINRLQAKYQLNANSNNAKKLEKKYKLKISIDDLYTTAKETNNFIWLRKDKKVGEHEVSQGILIYTYPYTSDSTFEINSLVKKRNEITKVNVIGGVENSYMQTYLEYVPREKEINWKGIYVKELRGLWHMKGDFMGGPFISYTMVDTQLNRVITIDGYVYAPKFDKREFIRELEALALTINF
ncbi:MAG: DUF4837 family protein [Vicingus serpentipes]|nr:DUF4837 family protein [Vicingus serpentipes]